MDFFGFILFGTLCVFWMWMSVSFPRLGKFQLLRLQICSLSLFLSLSSFYGTPLVRILVEMLFQSSLKLSSFLRVLFSFCYSDCCSDRVISTTLFSWSLIHFSVFSNLFIPSSVFFISIIILFCVIGSFLYFLSLCWSSHFIHSSRVHPFFPDFGEHFYDYTLRLFMW